MTMATCCGTAPDGSAGGCAPDGCGGGSGQLARRPRRREREAAEVIASIYATGRDPSGSFVGSGDVRAPTALAAALLASAAALAACTQSATHRAPATSAPP